MTDQNHCPQCGGILPPDTPQGLCPACLLKRGLEPNTLGYSADGPAHTDWDPPTVNRLIDSFPELEVLELIGRGGVGAVYKARQKELDRLVALKILPPEIGREMAFAQRFTREAQAMARLNHPNIVAIYDFGQRGELYFFLMEYVDGLSLRQVLNTGSVSSGEALAIVPQICDALQYAHDRGIVHRDIKPENILMNRQGQVKIADFGLAKLIGRSAAEVPTALEKVIGTPQYMAPEQIEHPAEVDHRADIYSLGVVFYQMLTGELPLGRFAPPSQKVLIDVRLDEVVLRALEKEPQRRYQQASEVKTQVETIVATKLQPSQESRESPQTPQRWKWMSNQWIPVQPWHRLVVVTGIRGGRRVVNGPAVLFWLAMGGFAVLMGLLLINVGGPDIRSSGTILIVLGIGFAAAPLFGWATLNFWSAERLLPLNDLKQHYRQASQVKTEKETIASTSPPAQTKPVSARTVPERRIPCYISTPEHLRTFTGRYIFIYTGRGELRLDSENLTLVSNLNSIVIPLANIKELNIGHYPRSAKPVRLNYIAVTFEETGKQQTLLFTPKLTLSPWETNRYVAECFQAIRDAIVIRTGNPPVTSSGVSIPDRYFLAALSETFRVMLPIMLIGGVIAAVTAFLSVLLTHRRGIHAAGAGSNIWLFILISGIGSVFVFTITAIFMARIHKRQVRAVNTPLAGPTDSGEPPKDNRMAEPEHRHQQASDVKANMVTSANTLPSVPAAPSASAARFTMKGNGMMKRELWVVYMLWFFFGLIGVHKFYLNKFGMGILYIFTGGIFLIGWFIDLFTIPRQVRIYNEQIDKMMQKV
jgi:serine/threonine protein kinase/TM2 domain-containing membrane protein YozV